MMNFVALGLVFTTLATAGVWSPSPNQERPQINQDVIVKDGHRTVEIEFGQDDGNTKVKISPQEAAQTHVDSGWTNPKGKLSEGVENVKEKMEEIGHRGPRELVCDAFGKCKHKIASTVEKTKEVLTEKAKEKVEEVKDRAEEVEEKVKDAAGETVGKVKDAASRTAQQAAEKAHDVKEKVRGVTKEAGDTGKTLGLDVKNNATSELGVAAEEFEKKGLKGILRKGREFLRHVLSPGLRASGVGIMQLLGLGMAYGMSIWVTFISSYLIAGAMSRQQFGILQTKIYPVYFRAMAYSVGMVLLGHWWSQRNCAHSGKADMFQSFNLSASLLMILFNFKYLEPKATKVMFERMKLEKEEGKGMEESPAQEPVARQIDAFNGTPEERSSAAADKTTSKTTATTVQQSHTQEKAEGTAGGGTGRTARTEMARLSESLKKLNSYSSFLNILTLMALSWHLVYLGQLLHSTAEC